MRDLAALAKVSTDTVVRFERGEPLKERTVDAIRSALESSGIVRIEEKAHGLPSVVLLIADGADRERAVLEFKRNSGIALEKPSRASKRNSA